VEYRAGRVQEQKEAACGLNPCNGEVRNERVGVTGKKMGRNNSNLCW